VEEFPGSAAGKDSQKTKDVDQPFSHMPCKYKNCPQGSFYIL